MHSLGARASRPQSVRKTLVQLILIGALLIALLASGGCRRRSNAFVIALNDNIRTIDPIGSATVDAASERVRTLMFNSLVKKDEKFDYVGELASSIQRSDDGLVYTFTIRDGVKFHDGRVLTSADAKYTLDTVLGNSFAKSASFFEGAGLDKRSYIKSVEAPDAKTMIVRLNKSWVGLLSNLVPIAIIPSDSYETEKQRPLGTGPFKFVSYDSAQQVLDAEANPDYWEGPPHISKIRVRVISDTNALQAELRSGRIDIAPMPTNLAPDAIKLLGEDPNLQVKQFPGSNLALLTFNTEQAPLNDARVREALCYGIDREGMLRNLILGQGKLAHSILPEESWAFTTSQQYSYDPAKAKQLLDDAGYKDPDGDGPQTRFAKPLMFRLSGASTAGRHVSEVVQNNLKQIGIPVSIETAELNTFLDQLRRGDFQIAYGNWVGGNQDPIFYKDLFASSEIPTEKRPSRNRSRYKNAELDGLLEQAVNSSDREKTKALYARVQEIVSRDAPILPLWYQANMVVAKKNVQNIQVDASGDWSFVRKLTVGN